MTKARCRLSGGRAGVPAGPRGGEARRSGGPAAVDMGEEPNQIGVKLEGKGMRIGEK